MSYDWIKYGLTEGKVAHSHYYQYHWLNCIILVISYPIVKRNKMIIPAQVHVNLCGLNFGTQLHLLLVPIAQIPPSRESMPISCICYVLISFREHPCISGHTDIFQIVKQEIGKVSETTIKMRTFSTTLLDR